MKKKKIILVIILIILIAVGVAAYINIDTLKALKNGVSYSSDELNMMIEENEQAESDALESLEQEQIRPLTNEEARELINGNITEEEAIGLILGKTTMLDIKAGKFKEEKEKKEENVENKNKLSIKEANDEIAKLVAKMYVLKSKFVSELNVLIADTKAEYIAMSPEEKASSSAKTKLGLKAMGAAGELESSCDAQVDEILKQIETLLEKSGQDKSLVDTIKSTYENEKRIKKASYISKYKNSGK